MTQKISSVNIESATLSSFTGPTISSVAIANSTYVILDDTAVSNAGGYAVITGSNFASGAQVLFGSTSATSVTYVNSTTLNVQVPALTAGSYVIYVQNPDGSTAIRLNGITSSPIPVWATGSTLENQVSNVSISISLSATSDSSVSYSLANGSSLPSGTTLAANGLFSGTISVSTETTYNFTVNAIDAENQDTSRSFSVTVVLGDSYFYNTILLLTGNGTNTGNNNLFLDSSNNNYTITRNANTTQGTFTPFSQTGWSNYFDGTGDYLSITNNTALNPGTSDFIMEAWVFITGTTGSNQGFNGKGTAGTDGYSFYITNGLVLSFVWNGTGGTTITAGTLSLNRWHHVAVVRNSNVIRLYLDGVGAGSSTACTTDITSTSTKFIGQARGGSPMLGYMSNYRMIKGSRPESYDATLSTLTVPTASLTSVANTSLLTCKSNGFIDYSSNDFTLTRSGDVSVQSFSPFAPTTAYGTSTIGGSVYFDGNGDWLDLSNIANLALGTGDFTWESWIYLDMSTLPSFAGIYDQRNGTNGLAVIQPVVELTSTNGYAWYVAAANKIASGTAPVKMRSWQHLSICRSSGVTKMFIDGKQVGTNYTDTNDYPSGTITIGRENDGVSTRYLTGYLSGLRVVKGTALYTANTAVPTSPPTAVANTALLCNFTNSNIIDYTSKNVIETYNQAQLSTSVKKYGSASILFDGIDDALVIPYSPLFNFGTGQFTIECWVNFSTLSGNRMIFDTYTAASAGGGYQLYWRGTGSSITFYANGVVIAQSSFASHVTGTWYHVAVTRDSSGIVRIFIDGTMYAYASYTSAIDNATTSRPSVGIQYTTATNDLHGYIDDLRITKGFARYSSNTSFTPPTTELLTQ